MDAEGMGPGLLLLPERMPTSLPHYLPASSGQRLPLRSVVHTLVFGAFCSCAFRVTAVLKSPLNVSCTVAKDPEVDECAVFIEETAALKLRPLNCEREFSFSPLRDVEADCSPHRGGSCM